jgi:hypothetical protein
MPVKNQPSPPRSRQIANILFLAASSFLVVNLLFPNRELVEHYYQVAGD